MEEIVEITRGHVRLRVGTRTVTIQGEGHLIVPGSPGYLVYSNTIRQWDPPHDGDPLTPEDKARILATLRACFDRKGTRYEIE